MSEVKSVMLTDCYNIISVGYGGKKSFAALRITPQYQCSADLAKKGILNRLDFSFICRPCCVMLT